MLNGTRLTQISQFLYFLNQLKLPVYIVFAELGYLPAGKFLMFHASRAVSL
ncbi:MAG: hypothetical protein UR93_C0025G0002 [Berkelbacteria bacterium GW2011_GWA2_35_9]|uniref:Uncharacterized protein n=1 Tax=Berkelbacteria bacterium GW2011_GWA2_35_9 TaxID=1618333 RepID=A0A0G0DGX0_9BACT|nr:MAG: hypothetical protein UR93_C0025G0002 [Berkelbacteria bacterium GW2011_GWA2_35_9]